MNCLHKKIEVIQCIQQRLCYTFTSQLIKLLPLPIISQICKLQIGKGKCRNKVHLRGVLLSFILLLGFWRWSLISSHGTDEEWNENFLQFILSCDHDIDLACSLAYIYNIWDDAIAWTGVSIRVMFRQMSKLHTFRLEITLFRSEN